MNDLISRKELLAAYDREHIGTPGRARKLIENAPAIDAAPVIHAHWQESREGWEVRHFCSNCKKKSVFYDKGYEEYIPTEVLSNYCPSCGALMDGKDENHE